MIEFFFDCSSPWTYLGFHNIQPLAAELKVPIRWRPILVGGVFNSVNPSVYASREKPVPAKRAYMHKDLQDWARLAGLTIVMPPKVFPVNSVKAMRGCLWLESLQPQGKLVPFATAVFEAYWGRDEDISQDAVLAEVCRRCGIEAAAFFAGIADAGSEGAAEGQHRRADAPRRLRLADDLRRRRRHVLRQRPAAAGGGSAAPPRRLRLATLPRPSRAAGASQPHSRTPMRLETIAVHGGQKPDPTTKAVAVPIYQTVAYAFDDTQHGADLFDLKVAGNIYTRIMNPTTAVLEQRLAELEGGIAALAVASGMAAISYAIQTIAETGDNIVSASTLYGGTYNLFAHTFPQLGIEARFADYRQPDAFEPLIDARTKAIFCESIGNPLGNITDIAALAAIAHKHGIPLIVDNTVPSPALCRPFELGADIVVHSLTKYCGGHGNSIGGAIVDSGKFPWAQHKARFRRLNEPDVSYHGVVYTEALGPAAYIGRARVVPLRNMGAALSPMNAFLILQGIETLALRMDRICDNTLKIAAYLKKHAKVGWVNYAGLPDHRDHALVQRTMGGRASGIVSFGVQGGRDGGARFQDALKLFTRLVNIGDARSLACHPASTTHRQLGPDELAKAGVSVDMVRLSVGIEHVDDLLEDLEQALAAV